MRDLLILLIVAALSTAFPYDYSDLFEPSLYRAVRPMRHRFVRNKPSNEELLKKMNENRARMEEYKEFIPKEFLEFYDSLSDEEKLNLTKFEVKVEGKKPNVNVQTTLEMSGGVSPTAQRKMESLFRTEAGKFGNLSDDTQEFFKSTMEDMKKMFDNSRFPFSDGFGMLKKVTNFFDENEKGRKEVEEQWPEVGNFLKSPFYDSMREMTKLRERQFQRAMERAQKMFEDPFFSRNTPAVHRLRGDVNVNRDVGKQTRIAVQEQEQ